MEKNGGNESCEDIRNILALVTLILNVLTVGMVLSAFVMSEIGSLVLGLLLGGVSAVADLIWLVYGCARLSMRIEERYSDKGDKDK